MSTVHERMPADELALRHARCRTVMARLMPEATGMLVFSPVNIYYLSGTLGLSCVLWFPMEGEPVLLVRRGLERAHKESPLRHIMRYRSFGDVAAACAEAGVPLGPVVGVEQGGLSWSLGEKLRAKFPATRFLDATTVLQRTRAVKTEYELAAMREAGRRHNEAFAAMAGTIKPGMTERDIALVAWHEFAIRDFGWVLRVTSLESEGYFGQLAVGPMVNQPFYNDGTIGYIGTHPATPYMGSSTEVWTPGTLLITDFTFCWHGYYSDKTQVFWSGSAASVPDTVRRAQDACMAIEERCAALLKPGATPAEIWDTARSMADKAGFADAFMGLNADRPKFVGHGIGLISDEWPAMAGGFNEPLETGMVIALEPKITFPDYGMTGVENVFEVTPEGGKSLSGTMYDLICME